MYRIRDFMFMDTINLSGKLLGFISDVLLDFNNKKVKGFVITPNSIFKKNMNVHINNIVSFTSVVIVTDVDKNKYFQFRDIKNMNVVDEKGFLIGMVEDVLFDEKNFSIRALILSAGFLDNFRSGKKILLIDKLILGERNLLYRGRKENLKFFTAPHKLFKQNKNIQN